MYTHTLKYVYITIYYNKRKQDKLAEDRLESRKNRPITNINYVIIVVISSIVITIILISIVVMSISVTDHVRGGDN